MAPRADVIHNILAAGDFELLKEEGVETTIFKQNLLPPSGVFFLQHFDCVNPLLIRSVIFYVLSSKSSFTHLPVGFSFLGPTGVSFPT